MVESHDLLATKKQMNKALSPFGSTAPDGAPTRSPPASPAHSALATPKSDASGLRLSSQPPSTAPATTTPQPATEGPRGGEVRIMLLSNDLTVRAAAREAVRLHGPGWSFESVSSLKVSHSAFRNPNSAFSARPSGIPQSEVLLMDIELRNGNGAEVAANLTKLRPELRIILLSKPSGPGSLSRSLITGVSGCIIAPFSTNQLFEVLRRAKDGRLALCPRAEGLLLKGLDHLMRVGQPGKLSDREQQVAWLLKAGLRNKAMANQLGLAPETIHTLLRRIYGKLGVHSRAEVVNHVLCMPRR